MESYPNHADHADKYEQIMPRNMSKYKQQIWANIGNKYEQIWATNMGKHKQIQAINMSNESNQSHQQWHRAKADECLGPWAAKKQQ